MMAACVSLGEPLPSPPADIPASSTGRAFGAATLVVLGIALYLRLCGAERAFLGTELVPVDGDSLYHLRRIRLTAESFPHVPWSDPSIAWPSPAPVPWAPGFDLMGALALRFGKATGGALGADLWVASLCPLLGVAVVGATMELVHALAEGLPGRRAATLSAGLLAAMVPQGMAISRFGCIDHHVAEALAMVLLARWALDPLVHPDVGTRYRVGFELAGGAVSGWAVWVFTGAPLYVAIAASVLLSAALLARRPRILGSGGPGLLLGAGLAALGTVPAVAAHGRALAFGFPSWLQPLLLATSGVALCAAVLCGARAAVGPRRAGVLLAAAAAVAAVAWVTFPSGAAQVVAAVREWLLKSDPWLARIDEFQPMLRAYGGVYRFLGAAGYAAPLAIALSAAALAPMGWRRAVAFCGVCVALLALMLLQLRFGRVFAPFLAASCGLGLAWAAGRLARVARVAWALPVLVALGLAILDPRIRATAFEPEFVPDGAVEAALDLRQRDPGDRPGVLAPWDLGNYFLVLAGRPVMTTGFGPYPDAAAYEEATRAFTLGERDLLPLLERRRIGWVAAGAANLFARVPGRTAAVPFSGRALSGQWLREVPSAPLLLGGSGLPSLGVPHFAHLMPVFASQRAVVGIDGSLPVLWTYQVVAGARLHGRAAAGNRIMLEVPLVEHGRTHVWRAFADADAGGSWTMTIPLPTDVVAAGISYGRGRLVQASQPPRAVHVPERAVRQGTDVFVPAS